MVLFSGTLTKKNIKTQKTLNGIHTFVVEPVKCAVLEVAIDQSYPHTTKSKRRKEPQNNI